MTEEYLKLRHKNYRTEFANSKKENPHSNGIRAEDIKACDDETREMVRQIFNEIIKQNEFTPEAWKKVRIKVIHKKGDVENVSNYRPICSLPALYELFSAICTEDYTQCLTRNEQKIRLNSENPPDNGPACNIQIDGTEMPGVGNQNVDSDGRLHEGSRLHLSQINLGGTQILQRRSRVRKPSEEDIQRPEGFGTYRCKEYIS